MIPKKKRREQSRIHGGIVAATFLVIFAGGIMFLAYQNVTINSKRAELNEKVDLLQAQAAELSERKVLLEDQVINANTQEFQEKILREQGLYQKPGEQVVTVLPPEKPPVEFEVESPPKRVWWNPLTW